MICTLPANPRDYSPDDRSTVESIEAAYESLSAEDQNKLDNMESHPETAQPLGRVLESALWTVWSFDVPDNSTVLPDNVYDGGTTPALVSAYSKGKSTSPRDRPWSVKEVEVIDGKAYATLVVQSSSYSGVLMHGTEYPRTNEKGNCEFAGIPIQLNTTFYFAGISTSMLYPIAFSLETSIDESAAAGTFLVTFTDGQGNVLEEQEVEYGQPAVPPADPALEGFVFQGWDPADFGFVTQDMTIEAVWKKSDESLVKEVREKITQLTDDPTTLIDQTGDASVAEAGELYVALGEELQARVPDDERLKLIRAMIADLPRDPYDVTANDGTSISRAATAYSMLPEAMQNQLDEELLMESRSYGRYLESAVWAFDALNAIDNSTSLGNGTYSKGIESTSSRGKSTSSRDTSFKVTSVTVSNGQAFATIESTAKTYQSIRLGGEEYPNAEADPNKKSRFENIPINLNSTFFFSAKARNATENTDAIAYEMAVSADEGSMKPDSSEKSETDGGGSKQESKGSSGSGSKGSASSGATAKTGKTTGKVLTPTGAKNTASATKLTATTGTRSASNANNLSSLLRKSSTTTQAAKKNSSKGGSSTKSESASDLADDSGISEVALADGGDSSQINVNVDLAPAVAGGSALSVALGILAFVLRFVRREGLLLPF